MHNLGAMLENGRGTSKNLAEAKFWYERAAALGYAPALNDLGRLYLAGAGVPKNYVRAKISFEQAAKLGDARAMNNLGMLYLNGTGVQRNINLARIWFEKAITLKQCGSTGKPQASRRSGSSRRRPSCRETSVLHADVRSAPPIVREFRL